MKGKKDLSTGWWRAGHGRRWQVQGSEITSPVGIAERLVISDPCT